MFDEKIRNLLIQYRDTVDELRDMGIIRTSNVVSDVGEYIVCKLLGLTKAPTGTIGYDATKDGMKYQIKSRKATKWRIPTNFPITEEQLKIADFVIYVEFDNDWNIAKLLKILSEEVTPNKYGRVPISKELVRRYSILEEIAI